MDKSLDIYTKYHNLAEELKNKCSKMQGTPEPDGGNSYYLEEGFKVTITGNEIEISDGNRTDDDSVILRINDECCSFLTLSSYGVNGVHLKGYYYPPTQSKSPEIEGVQGSINEESTERISSVVKEEIKRVKELNNRIESDEQYTPQFTHEKIYNAKSLNGSFSNTDFKDYYQNYLNTLYSALGFFDTLENLIDIDRDGTTANQATSPTPLEQREETLRELKEERDGLIEEENGLKLPTTGPDLGE